MNELRIYYLKCLATLAVTLAVLLLMVEVAHPLKPSVWQILLLSRPTAVVYLVLGERVLRKTLWKLQKPALNFQASWRGEVTYQAGTSTEPSFVAGHMFRIEQDCLSIRIMPATPKEFVNWGPLAVEVIEDTVRYAYWVNYGNSNLPMFPESAKGYVEMRVTGYDDKKKPRIMTGSFWHFAQTRDPAFQKEKSPVFEGTISLYRESED